MPPEVPADLLDLRFRVERVVGAGSMGLVLAAHHLALDIPVAIKLMLPELRARRDLVDRFLREARAAARLTSPHVTRVLDVGTLDDGAPYIVMEYLEGCDLAMLLREHGPIAAARAAAMVRDACHAIAEAHAAGVIHRDLKPANLFVARGRAGSSIVKVIDLGICRLTTRIDGANDTVASTTLGTPSYMAPEQLRSARNADARSDIWSLGAILYELVAGHPPVRGDTVGDIYARAMLEPIPPIGRGVPRAFEAVVARCLARDPSARFQTAAELAAALAPLCSGQARRVRRVRRVVVASLLGIAGTLGLWRPTGQRAPAELALTSSPALAAPPRPPPTPAPPAAMRDAGIEKAARPAGRLREPRRIADHGAARAPSPAVPGAPTLDPLATPN